MNRVVETINFCRQAQFEGGPFGIELLVHALHLPSAWTDDFFDYFRDWRWSLTRIIYGYRFVYSVMSHLRGINLKAPNEVVFDAYTHPDKSHYDFSTITFRYRYFLWHRYCYQIYTTHDFDLYPPHVQDWVLDLATRHFRGERFGYIVIQGTEEAWEILTHGKYKPVDLTFPEKR